MNPEGCLDRFAYKTNIQNFHFYSFEERINLSDVYEDNFMLIKLELHPSPNISTGGYRCVQLRIRGFIRLADFKIVIGIK